MRSFRIAIMLLMACASIGFLIAKDRGRSFAADEYANAIEREMIEAAFLGKTDKVKDCLTKGARIDARYGGDPKFFAGADGGWPMSGANWTALMAATESDHFEIGKFLISKGANLSLDDGWGATPLYALAEKRKPRQDIDALAALFIKNGANVNAKTDVCIDGPVGETILHRAICWGHAELVKILLAAGADVNAETTWGATPLDYVVEGRNDEAIREYLKKSDARHGRQSQGSRKRD